MNKVEISAKNFETFADTDEKGGVRFKTKFLTRPRDSGQYIDTSQKKTDKFETNMKDKYNKVHNYLIITNSGCVLMKQSMLYLLGYNEKGVKMKCVSKSGDIPIWAQDKEELEKELI